MFLLFQFFNKITIYLRRKKVKNKILTIFFFKRRGKALTFKILLWFIKGLSVSETNISCLNSNFLHNVKACKIVTCEIRKKKMDRRRTDKKKY